MTQKPTHPTSNEPDWMVVYTTSNFSEAHIIAGRLDSAGIKPYVHSQPGASAMGITLGTFGAIQVLVRPDDYDDAYDLLYPEDVPDELEANTDDFYVIDPDNDDQPDDNSS